MKNKNSVAMHEPKFLNAGIILNSLFVDTCLKWDALISRRRSYNAQWILDEIR